MSDNENENIEEKPFLAERSKNNRATCKKCKEKILKGELRIAKLAPNPFGCGNMKLWHHVSCLFDQFLAQRVTTKRLESIDDIDGWDNLEDNEKEDFLKSIEETEKKIADKTGVKYSPKKLKPKVKPDKNNSGSTSSDRIHKIKASSSESDSHKIPKDNLFREFRRLVAEITNENSYLEKSAIIKYMFTKGSDGKGFKGDIIQWCRLLLPGVINRIYNLESKQLVKIFSEIFCLSCEDMLQHLKQVDVSETIQHFFENNETINPSKKSNILIEDVDDFLDKLSKLATQEDEQIKLFKNILEKCTGNDLKIIICLIKNDLGMNAGEKIVLNAVHSNAYEAFQDSHDLAQVLKRFFKIKDYFSASACKSVKASVSAMTPVLPMLAEACSSFEQALRKYPTGMYCEIKYDGERVQVHKHGSEFKYYSRSLKPVLSHKINHFKEYVPQAFTHTKDLILDSEVLLIDTTTGKPLPFVSLSKYKKEEFKNANVCVFVFDCMYYNGESLMNKPIKERRKILKENMNEIPNYVMFSESEEVFNAKDFAVMMAKVLQFGLEGLVLKDLESIYEPGKRHWLKVKKDYLCDVAMADSADLIVLGAWFGTDKKEGMMSVFLMGCYDKHTNTFLTVTKVQTEYDYKTLEQLQTKLDMIKISGEPSKVPDWLKCPISMIPDFVAKDPKKQPVWEITGAEFIQQEVHTADGISIQFPKITRIRDDKTWETATNLKELKKLYTHSKETTNYRKLLKEDINTNSDKSSSSESKQVIDAFVEVQIRNEKTTDHNKLLEGDIKPDPDESSSSEPKQVINTFVEVKITNEETTDHSKLLKEDVKTDPDESSSSEPKQVMDTFVEVKITNEETTDHSKLLKEDIKTDPGESSSSEPKEVMDTFVEVKITNEEGIIKRKREEFESETPKRIKTENIKNEKRDENNL